MKAKSIFRIPVFVAVPSIPVAASGLGSHSIKENRINFRIDYAWGTEDQRGLYGGAV